MSDSHEIPARIEEILTVNRRGFLRSAGLLAVSFGGFSAGLTEADAQAAAAPQGPGPYPTPDFRQIDSWIVIHPDSTATFYVGKTDPGQGTGTGFRQLMSDELDIASTRPRALWGARTSRSIRSARAAPPLWRGIHGRCAVSPRKRAACCSQWERSASECRSINLP